MTKVYFGVSSSGRKGEGATTIKGTLRSFCEAHKKKAKYYKIILKCCLT